MTISITLLYAGLFGLFLTLLSFNVMHHWVRVTGAGQETDTAFRRAERLLSNFVEYVPLGLILLALLENAGVTPFLLHILGGGFVFSRFLHAMGSNVSKASGFLRFIGAQLSFLIIALASLGCLYCYILGSAR